MLSVLSVFGTDNPSRTVEEISQELDISVASAYRYVRTLVQEGFLSKLPGKHYALGIRIIELDRDIRHTESVLVHSEEPMRRLSQATGKNVYLFTYYGQKIMCTNRVWARFDDSNQVDRGHDASFFRGAAGRVILAHLPAQELRRIHHENTGEIRESGLGATLTEFRNSLKTIRNAGHYLGVNEVFPGVVGLGVPVQDEEGVVTTSMTIATTESEIDEEFGYLLPLLTATAQAIQASLRKA